MIRITSDRITVREKVSNAIGQVEVFDTDLILQAEGKLSEEARGQSGQSVETTTIVQPPVDSNTSGFKPVLNDGSESPLPHLPDLSPKKEAAPVKTGLTPWFISR